MSMNKVSSGCTRLIKSFTFSFLIVLFFNASSFSQAIYWENFRQTTILNDSLVSLPSYDQGTALSQNRLFNQSNWSVTYNVSFESVSKILGVINPKDNISLANMDLGLYFSSAEEKIITYFIHGKKLESISARNGDRLRISFFEGRLELFLNEALLYDEFFEFENHNVFSAILHKDATFERMEFITDYVDVFVAEFDTLTNLGSIHVNLPDDAPAGPYHYLIGEEGYVDLDSIYQEMLTLTDILPTDSMYNIATCLERKYSFEGLETGRYFISVIDSRLQTIEHAEIIILPKLELLSNSDLAKEGELFVSGIDNSLGDLNVFISNENLSGNFGVEIYDVQNLQYFGFGLDETVMSGIGDILYGFCIEDNKLTPILDGVVDYNRTIPIENRIKLFLEFDEGVFTFYKDSSIVLNSTISDGLMDSIIKSEISLNLKFGLSKKGIQLKPLLHNYYSLFYSINASVHYLDCDYGAGGVSFYLGYTPFYSLNFYSLVLKNENNQQVGSINQMIFNNLQAGVYTLTGVVSFTNLYGTTINRVINRKVVLGYKAEWIIRDSDYIEVPNSYSVLVEGHNESVYLKARSNNYLKYNEDGWIEYSSNIQNNNSGQIFRFLTSNLAFTPQQSEIYNEDFILHANFINNKLLMPYSAVDGFQTAVYINDNARITIKLTTNASTGFPYGKVKVFVNDVLRSVFPRSNSSVSIMPNSNKNGSGFKNVISSFGCPESKGLYGHLKPNLDGFYHTMKNGKIRFVFDQEYASDSLKFNIYDDNDLQIRSESDFPVISTSHGKNYLLIDVSTSENCIGKGFRYLEVINSKNEKLYLRFYNDHWVEECDGVYVDPNNPNE